VNCGHCACYDRRDDVYLASFHVKVMLCVCDETESCRPRRFHRLGYDDKAKVTATVKVHVYDGTEEVNEKACDGTERGIENESACDDMAKGNGSEPANCNLSQLTMNTLGRSGSKQQYNTP